MPECVCKKCRNNGYPNPRHWNFLGDGPPFYGMELEVTGDVSWDVPRRLLGDLGDVVSDPSVRGFEMRTQPMSYGYFMANFPWPMLRELRAQGCRILKESNGLHIHVSRAGFSGPAHTHRWLKFWYRNQDPIIRIARRHSDWGFFNPEARRGQFAHVRSMALENRVADAEHELNRQGRRGNREPYQSLYEKWQKASDGDSTRYDRYMAINTEPDTTFEIRLFAATLRPRRAQAALGLAAGTVEYTRHLTLGEIRQGGWDWDAFAAWAKGQGCYQPLIQTIEGEV